MVDSFNFESIHLSHSVLVFLLEISKVEIFDNYFVDNHIADGMMWGFLQLCCYLISVPLLWRGWSGEHYFFLFCVKNNSWNWKQNIPSALYQYIVIILIHNIDLYSFVMIWDEIGVGVCDLESWENFSFYVLYGWFYMAFLSG